MNVRPGTGKPIATRTQLAVALMMALPLALSAQDEFTLEEPTAPPPDPEKVAELTEVRNWVEVGAGWVSDDSFRFGRYTGLQSQGGYGVLSLEYLMRGPYDGDSADYLLVRISNLGLESREATVEYGRQGDFALRAGYDGLVHYRSDSASTPFQGVGETRLSLPGDWVAAGSTSGMSLLLPSLHEVDLSQRRHRSMVGFDKEFQNPWSFSVDFHNEDRNGLKSVGGVVGNSGGNPRAVLLPEPIDYRTQQFDAVARYVVPRQQIELRYHASLFDNAHEGLVWQNPYSAISGWHPSAGHPGGFGQLALPPDNQFHQISAGLGRDVGAALRFSGEVALGRMTQDEDFLPYTINPELAGSVTQPLPRASLDGRIDTTVANLRLSSRGSGRLHWVASYRYDDRDNRTPREEYVYIGGDSQEQDTSATSSRRRFNEPYSYRDQRLRFDAGWRLQGNGRLSGSAERRETERTFSEREEATEDTLQLGYSHDFSDLFSASLRALRADRSGSTYHGNEPFVSGYAPDYVATVPGGWENIPGLRKFHLADRERTQWVLSAQLTPSEHWSLGLDAYRSDDDYDSSEYGLTDAVIDAYTLDLSYTPSAAWSAHAWYAYEDLQFDQNGQAFGGGNNRIVQANDPARAWTVDHEDRVDSLGAGVDWRATGNLRLGAELLYVRSEADVELTAGPALTAAPLPTSETRLRSLALKAGWKLRSNLALNLRYWYEAYDSTDWAVDDIAVNQLANVILFGETSPDYDVHAIAVSFVFTF